jgi:AraC-like DNA-binding protein
MLIEKFAPRACLKPFVQNYLIIESENGMQNKILPGASIVMSFRIRGSVSFLEEGRPKVLPAAGITGIRKLPRTVSYSPGAATLLVMFAEGGAAAFFHEPMHKLFETNLALTDLMDDAALRVLEDRLFEAQTHRQRIALVETFLLSRLRGPSTDPLIAETLRKIQAAGGRTRIRELLQGMPISRDTFEKRFRTVVGTSPGRYGEIVRMRKLIDAYSPEKTLTEIAYQAGYFDQAHFIKNFRTFTGQTPGEFFAAPAAW